MKEYFTEHLQYIDKSIKENWERIIKDKGYELIPFATKLGLVKFIIDDMGIIDGDHVMKNYFLSINHNEEFLNLVPKEFLKSIFK